MAFGFDTLGVKSLGDFHYGQGPPTGTIMSRTKQVLATSGSVDLMRVGDDGPFVRECRVEFPSEC